MSENSILIWQSQIDHYDKDIKALKEKKKAIINEAETHGFFFDNGKFQLDETVLGMIGKWAYYSKYVGEKGAMYNYDDSADYPYHYREGNKKWSKELFQGIIEFYEKIKSTLDNVSLEIFFEFFDFFRDMIGECISLPSANDLNGKNWPYSKMTQKEREERLKELCLEYFSMFSVKDGYLSFRYIGNSDQEEYVNGSGFDIGFYKKKFIQNYDSTSYNDRFGEYEFDVNGKVKW